MLVFELGYDIVRSYNVDFTFTPIPHYLCQSNPTFYVQVKKSWTLNITVYNCQLKCEPWLIIFCSQMPKILFQIRVKFICFAKSNGILRESLCRFIGSDDAFKTSVSF